MSLFEKLAASVAVSSAVTLQTGTTPAGKLSTFHGTVKDTTARKRTDYTVDCSDSITLYISAQQKV